MKAVGTCHYKNCKQIVGHFSDYCSQHAERLHEELRQESSEAMKTADPKFFNKWKKLLGFGEQLGLYSNEGAKFYEQLEDDRDPAEYIPQMAEDSDSDHQAGSLSADR